MAVAILSPLHYPMLLCSGTIGYAKSLKEEQQKSVETVYQGTSVFVWLPTVFGKSICYQHLPFVIEYKKGQCGNSSGITPNYAVQIIASFPGSLIGKREEESLVSAE